MHGPWRTRLFDQLMKHSDELGPAADLVQGAVEGQDALVAALDGRPPVARPEHEEARDSAPVVWLNRIAVRGFRGIGPEVQLDLVPAPGLVLVVGRNGSGKSSLAEGLEVLLTGNSRRFEDRPVEWQEGWRNLASGGNPRVIGSFNVDGDRSITIERSWPGDVQLADGIVRYQRGVEPMKDGLGDLHWEEAIASWRPLLGTTELQRMFDGGPSRLFDGLRGILGLDEIVEAQKRLAEARKTFKRTLDALKDQLKALRSSLSGVADPRAAEAEQLLAAKKIDRDRLLRLTSGETVSDQTAALQALTQLVPPDLEAVQGAVAGLRQAVASVAAEVGAIGQADLLAAEVLRSALDWHAAHGDGPCPVCDMGSLDASWRARADVLLRERKLATKRASDARAALSAAETSARAWLRAGKLPSASEVDTSAAVRAAAAMEAGRELTGLALADHVASAVAAYADALRSTSDAAKAALKRHDAVWAPSRTAIQKYLDAADAAEPSKDRFKQLERAEDWLKKAEGELRDEAFAPIASRAKAIWEVLRQSSSVELSDIRLTGTSNRRRVDIDVSIDGATSVALSVMSQGEINSLALALFLPRATQDASPFRFLVVDDPVQSMDPSKVDGLARLLAEEAERRQVIVFTHDPRLAEAVRRLRLPAQIVAVTRRGGSVVELREVAGPVLQYLDDATAAAEADGLRGLASHVVPGLCRDAVEARLVDSIRRKRLGRGESHEDVSDLLREARTLTTLFALARFDDAGSGARVLPWLNDLAPTVADTFKAIQRGIHHGAANPSALVSDTRDLLRHVERDLP